MTAFHLNVDIDNAAFDPDPRPELARILRDVAGRVEGGERADDIGWYQTILDVNGNDVGRFALKNSDGSPWMPATVAVAPAERGLSTYAGLRDWLDGYTSPGGVIQGDPASLAAEAVASGMVARDAEHDRQHEPADSDDRDYTDADRDAGRYPDSAPRP